MMVSLHNNFLQVFVVLFFVLFCFGFFFKQTMLWYRGSVRVNNVMGVKVKAGVQGAEPLSGGRGGAKCNEAEAS